MEQRVAALQILLLLGSGACLCMLFSGKASPRLLPWSGSGFRSTLRKLNADGLMGWRLSNSPPPGNIPAESRRLARQKREGGATTFVPNDQITEGTTMEAIPTTTAEPATTTPTEIVETTVTTPSEPSTTATAMVTEPVATPATTEAVSTVTPVPPTTTTRPYVPPEPTTSIASTTGSSSTTQASPTTITQPYVATTTLGTPSSSSATTAIGTTANVTTEGREDGSSSLTAYAAAGGAGGGLLVILAVLGIVYTVHFKSARSTRPFLEFHSREPTPEDIQQMETVMAWKNSEFDEEANGNSAGKDQKAVADDLEATNRDRRNTVSVFVPLAAEEKGSDCLLSPIAHTSYGLFAEENESGMGDLTSCCTEAEGVADLTGIESLALEDSAAQLPNDYSSKNPGNGDDGVGGEDEDPVYGTANTPPVPATSPSDELVYESADLVQLPSRDAASAVVQSAVIREVASTATMTNKSSKSFAVLGNIGHVAGALVLNQGMEGSSACERRKEVTTGRSDHSLDSPKVVYEASSEDVYETEQRKSGNSNSRHSQPLYDDAVDVAGASEYSPAYDLAGIDPELATPANRDGGGDASNKPREGQESEELPDSDSGTVRKSSSMSSLLKRNTESTDLANLKTDCSPEDKAARRNAVGSQNDFELQKLEARLSKPLPVPDLFVPVAYSQHNEVKKWTTEEESTSDSDGNDDDEPVYTNVPASPESIRTTPSDENPPSSPPTQVNHKRPGSSAGYETMLPAGSGRFQSAAKQIRWGLRLAGAHESHEAAGIPAFRMSEAPREDAKSQPCSDSGESYVQMSFIGNLGPELEKTLAKRETQKRKSS